MAGSVGNLYGGPVHYPANLFEVVAVTAIDRNNVRPDFTAVGPEVEFAAPGVDILTLKLGGGTATVTGTSPAVPHVTAAAAVLKAYDPLLTNRDIRIHLRNTAIPLGDANVYGFGLVQVADALSAAAYKPPPSDCGTQIVC